MSLEFILRALGDTTHTHCPKNNQNICNYHRIKKHPLGYFEPGMYIQYTPSAKRYQTHTVPKIIRTLVITRELKHPVGYFEPRIYTLSAKRYQTHTVPKIIRILVITRQLKHPLGYFEPGIYMYSER